MRKIIHLDLDAFFCAVEERSDPSLRGKCFAVGGAADRRGVVASCSYAARQKGVRSAMPMAKAMQLCPELIRIRGNHPEYQRASRHVMVVLKRFTAMIEQISIDEAFLDVSSVTKHMREIGREVQQCVNEETRLPCSVGVASNKLVAKIANDFGKSKYEGTHYPNALTVIEAGKESDFLAPLPVRHLWGVGPKTAESLHHKGIHTIGDLAMKDEGELVEWYGMVGPHMKRLAQGIDNRPVADSPVKNKSISNEVTFANDITEWMILKSTIERIIIGLAGRLQKEKKRASVVRIKFRWSDFTTFTRQITITPTDDVSVLRKVGIELLQKNWDQEKPIRLIGVAVSGLVNREDQLSLWDRDVEKKQDIFEAVSLLEEKFGQDVIKKGSALAKEEP